MEGTLLNVRGLTLNEYGMGRKPDSKVSESGEECG